MKMLKKQSARRILNNAVGVSTTIVVVFPLNENVTKDIDSRHKTVKEARKKIKKRKERRKKQALSSSSVVVWPRSAV
jgi:hypothetical protein